MRKYLFVTISIFLLSAGICVVTLFNVNASDASAAVITSFFVFLLVSIQSFAVGLYFMFGKRDTLHIPIKTLLRRTFFLGAGIVGLLAMSSLNVLNLFSAATFAAAVLLSELFFTSRSRANNLKNNEK